MKPSSTSSSELAGGRFIAASVACGLILILLYAGWIASTPHFPVEGENQRESGELVAERLLYPRSPTEVVLVGSSISARLPQDALGERILNAGMARQSPLVPLELLVGAGWSPRLVMVEINRLHLQPDRALLDHTLKPQRHWLMERVPVLRASGRPMNRFTGLVRRAVAKRGGAAPDPVGTPPKAMLESFVAKEMSVYTRTFEAGFLDDVVHRLKSASDRLSSRGCRLMFVELPFDTQFAGAPRMVDIRRRLATEFPESQFRHVDFAGNGPWALTDGLHLRPRDASRLAGLLREQAPEWIASP